MCYVKNKPSINQSKSGLSSRAGCDGEPTVIIQICSPILSIASKCTEIEVHALFKDDKER